jgi:hypothetical protein
VGLGKSGQVGYGRTDGVSRDRTAWPVSCRVDRLRYRVES